VWLDFVIASLGQDTREGLKMGRREPFQVQDRSIVEPTWRGDMIPDSPEELVGLGKRYMKTRHRLHQTELFSEEALIKLIDSYPRQLLQAFTMGTDPEKMDELQPVDTAGVTGGEILEALKIGRLWFKLLRIFQWKGPYANVIRLVYDELQGNVLDSSRLTIALTFSSGRQDPRCTSMQMPNRTCCGTSAGKSGSGSIPQAILDWYRRSPWETSSRMFRMRKSLIAWSSIGTRSSTTSRPVIFCPGLRTLLIAYASPRG
jgi:hypothetical protein